MPNKESEAPTYLGHRARLRAKFLADNGANMPDYELLELLLTIAIPRRDVKPLAKKLIAEFGNISGVINAPYEKLIEVSGISETSAAILKIVAACGVRSSSESLCSRDDKIFTFWSDFLGFCRQKMAYNETETLQIFFLNDNLKYLGDEVLSRGTVNKLSVYTRDIINAALKHNATGIVLAHNHPSGDCEPSDEDLFLTSEIAELLKGLDIVLHDHLIVTKSKIFSFRDAGLMNTSFNQVSKKRTRKSGLK